MSMQEKHPTDLVEADIRELVESQIPEGKQLDYKRDLPKQDDKSKKEFLFDISSFANASGGYLIYGIAEEKGIPTDLCGVEVTDQDAEIRRLESMMAAGIRPRIPRIVPRFISIAGSKPVLAIHIPRSWQLPHMVTFQETNKFYSRNSARKYLLDVGELRTLFNASTTAAEQVRQFRIERISKIVADETPSPLIAGPKVVVHVIPLESLSASTPVDISEIDQRSDGLLLPLGTQGYNPRVNLDGLLRYSQHDKETVAYLQLFRNGMIETVNATVLNSTSYPKVIPSIAFEQYLIERIPLYVEAVHKMQFGAPIVIMLTMMGVKGFSMAVDTGVWGGYPIDRDLLSIPEILLETSECTPKDLKPMIDAVWNAAGHFKSPYFDSEGNWKPPRR